MPSRWAASCTVTLSMTVKCTRLRRLGIWGCRHQGRRCPQTPHKRRSTLGCDKGPDERAYARRAMSPLGGCAGRRKKGRNSMGCLFFVFFRQLVRKEVWVEVPKGTKHPPVLLDVLIGVGR